MLRKPIEMPPRNPASTIWRWFYPDMRWLDTQSLHELFDCLRKNKYAHVYITSAYRHTHNIYIYISVHSILYCLCAKGKETSTCMLTVFDLGIECYN